MNYMMHIRGSPHDYNVWAKNGCTGWSYNEVLPYFKKAETAQDITGEDSGKIKCINEYDKWAIPHLEQEHFAIIKCFFSHLFNIKRTSRHLK